MSLTNTDIRKLVVKEMTRTCPLCGRRKSIYSGKKIPFTRFQGVTMDTIFVCHSCISSIVAEETKE